MDKNVPHRLIYKIIIAILFIFLIFLISCDITISKIYENKIAEYENTIEKYERN